MPILFHQHIAQNGELGLWEITEPPSYFLHRLRPKGEEATQLKQLKGKSRRLEWMAVRWLLHKMSGRRKRSVCLKDEFGKPHLVDSAYEISFSHSKQLVAVVAAPVLCGVDIQNITPSVERIAPKFMRPEEMKSLKSKTKMEHLHVYWGAKEALYKAYGRKELEFKKHILIEPFEYNLKKGTCTGQVTKGDFSSKYSLWYQKVDNHMLVYCLFQK
ncbi:MAG TPA: 4'-phosphopantetheinyl transferase superfamily protein [Phaeodactylibacter sp.]|nr:4'-phosphopantetheinyl transferase superfamily protein [Phaeodactylibacter sp.]